MQKMIHINAQCQAFTIFRLVPENQVEDVLEGIKDCFLDYQREFVEVEIFGSIKQFKRKIRFPNDKLIVKTGILNPELPFV